MRLTRPTSAALAASSHGPDRTNIFNQTEIVYDVRLGGTHHTRLAGLEAGHQFQDRAAAYGGRYRLALNAENVLNRRYAPTANGDNNISPGAPRNVQVSLRAGF